MQNVAVDSQQFTLRSMCDHTPVEELEKRIINALKTKQRALDPQSLPKSGERIKNGPPIMVRPAAMLLKPEYRFGHPKNDLIS